MNVVFYENALMLDFMNDGSVLAILIFAVLHLAILGLFLLVAEKFYINSVSRLGEGEHRTKNKAVHLEKALRPRSAFRAYMRKEWKILRRTPVFFTNCILVTAVWVVFVIIAGSMTGTDMTPSALNTLYNGGESGFALGVMIFSGAITMIMGSMNCLGSNCFSREGRHFEVLQYIPVPLNIQWHAKGMLGTLVTLLGTAPFFLIFGIYAGLPVHHILLHILLSAASSFGITYLGMMLDSINPKLAWEDALTALRENYNTFFCMALAIGIAAVMAGIGILVYAVLGLPTAAAGVVLLLIVALFDYLIYRKCMTRGLENSRRVGE